MKTGTIYAFYNRFNEVVYVGKTIKPIRKRHREHLATIENPQTKFSHWLMDEHFFGRVPRMEALEQEVPLEDLDEMERAYIQKYKGPQLLNTACMRVPAKPERPDRIVHVAPGFLPWLRKQTWRDDTVGDLARDIQHYGEVPQTCKRHVLSRHFGRFNRSVSHAFYSAWREFRGSRITKDFMRKLREEMLDARSYGTSESYRRDGYLMKVEQ